MELFSLKGRVALVTGGARGIGAGLAIGLAEAGADLAIVDRLDSSETATAVTGYGRQAISIERGLLGLTPDSAEAIVSECIAALGRLDILVNNAGIIRRTPALDMSAEDWSAVLDVNLSSAFYLAQAAARHFVSQSQPGKIVNVASMLSFQGGIQVASYAAAKSALAGLTRALANEWAPHGINVNAIAPGYFATEVTAELRSDPIRSEAVLSRIPAGRWGQPHELQGAIIYLASRASDYAHGSILAVDGGWLAR